MWEWMYVRVGTEACGSGCMFGWVPRHVGVDVGVGTE